MVASHCGAAPVPARQETALSGKGMASVEGSQQGGDTGSGVGECLVPLGVNGQACSACSLTYILGDETCSLTSASMHQKSWFAAVATFSIVLFAMSA